jgi:hypothetical protein
MTSVLFDFISLVLSCPVLSCPVLYVLFSFFLLAFFFYPASISTVGSKPHENQAIAPVGKTLPSFIPPQRTNFIGSLNSVSNNNSSNSSSSSSSIIHSNQDFTKVGDIKREGVISQKSASAEKRPRKARPPKKKGDEGPSPGPASSAAPSSSSSSWPEGGTEGGIVNPGSVGDQSASAEGDAKVKVKRKYVRPAKQKADSAGAAGDSGMAGEGAEGSAGAADGAGARSEVKAESKSGEKEEGGEEGEEDATTGVKRKREGTGRGSRGGKARGMGRGQKAISSPNTAKRLKSGSPFPDGTGPAEGLAAVKEEVREDLLAVESANPSLHFIREKDDAV